MIDWAIVGAFLLDVAGAYVVPLVTLALTVVVTVILYVRIRFK